MSIRCAAQKPGLTNSQRRLLAVPWWERGGKTEMKFNMINKGKPMQFPGLTALPRNAHPSSFPVEPVIFARGCVAAQAGASPRDELFGKQ